MLVAKEHREKLNQYCMVKKVTQEVAVNEMIRNGLMLIEQDPVMKAKMDRVKALQEELAAL